ncbi:hypothetical protein N9410_00895 [Methylophilaceae bacterium]|nr:hypothetical protein [Methylophilaceae bacterium]
MENKTYSEPRTIKPNNLWNLNLLDNIEWKLYKDDLYTKDNKIIIDDAEKKVTPSIKIHINQAVIDDDNFIKGKCDLAVIYSHSILKENRIIKRVNLEDNIEEIVIPHDMEDELIWDHRAQLKIIVFARNDMPEKNLSKNQLIAKQILKISEKNEDQSGIFKFNWLTRDEFKKLGLPSKTSYYFAIDVDFLMEDVTNANDAITVNMAEELKNIANEKESFIGFFLSDLYSNILIQGYADVESYEDLNAKSLLAQVTNKVSKANNNISHSDLVRDAKNEEYSKIKAFAQHCFDLSKYLTKDFDYDA